jgi:hypothetical protein
MDSTSYECDVGTFLVPTLLVIRVVQDRLVCRKCDDYSAGFLPNHEWKPGGFVYSFSVTHLTALLRMVGAFGYLPVVCVDEVDAEILDLHRLNISTRVGIWQ